MKWILTALFVAGSILLETCVGQTSAPPADLTFDCRRHGLLDDSCSGVNSTCGADDGKCVCEDPDNQAGYDCAYNSTAVLEKCAPKECRNGATCWENAGEQVCFCEEGFYGKLCDVRRAFPECEPDHMLLNINPYIAPDVAFEGKIYVAQNEGDEKCNLVAATKEGWEGFQQEILYSDCGGATEELLDNGDTKKSFPIIVQHHAERLSEFDQRFIVECVLRKSGGNLDFGNEVKDAYPDVPEESLTGGVIEAEVNPIDITVSTEDGTAITGPQTIGTKLVLKYTLNGGSVYKAFKVEKVVADNLKTGDDYLSLDFVADNCAQKGAEDVLLGFAGDAFTEVSITFRLFKFLHSNTLNFLNTVKLCQDDVGECNATMCDATGIVKEPDFMAGIGRRKRDVEAVRALEKQQDEFHSKWRTYNTRIQVYFPFGKKQLNNAGEVQTHAQTSCFKSTSFVVIVSTLVVLLTLTLGVTAYFGLKLSTRSTGASSSGHTYIGDSPPPTPVINNGFKE